MKKLFLLLLGLGLVQACTSGNQDENTSQHEITVNDLSHNSRNSVDWAGLYAGVVPCADCEGISTMLSLQDSIYVLKTYYLSESAHPTRTTGTFSWSDDGGTITLSGIDNGPFKYKVGENRLFQLDLEGNEIDGPLKNHYVLTKIDPDLLDVTWELSELDGKAVTYNDSKPVTLTINGGEININGFAGCNAYGGDVSFDSDKLQFMQIISTQMACDHLPTENRFLTVMQEIDGYTLQDDVFMLTKDDKPLAGFRKGK